MTITQQQTFNPPFSNPDDMPEYVSIYEMKPKRKSGRPKSSLTDEERAQKKKMLIRYGIIITGNTEHLNNESTMKTTVKEKTNGD